MIASLLRRAFATAARMSLTDRARLLQQAPLQAERDRVLDRIADAMPLNPVLQGGKVYAQSDEDGILAEIFRRIGTGSRVFVEFGCGDGTENNTHALLLQGWRGVWVDGGERNLERIRTALPRKTDAPELLLAGVFVTQDNVARLAEQALGLLPDPQERIDLLSMDLDGNDLTFLERLLPLRPRVFCCEYNAQLGPDVDAAVAYDAGHVWQGDDYMGASLSALRRVLEPAGYRLICCNISGANAFFVEAEHAGLFGDYDPAALFQPPRYHFIFLDDFHPRSLRHLAARIGFAEIDAAA